MITLAVASIAGAVAGSAVVFVADLRHRVRRLELWRQVEIDLARPRWEQPDPTYGPPEDYGPPS